MLEVKVHSLITVFKRSVNIERNVNIVSFLKLCAIQTFIYLSEHCARILYCNISHPFQLVATTNVFSLHFEYLYSYRVLI